MLRNPEFWVLVSFVLFFVLFGRKLWSVLAGMLDARADAVRSELAEAQRLRSEAEAMLADAETARAAALKEAAETLARAHVEAAQLAEAAAAEAASAGKRRERMALERIAAAEKAALDEVRKTAALVATAAAERVISQGIGDAVQGEILDQAIASLPRALRSA